MTHPRRQGLQGIPGDLCPAGRTYDRPSWPAAWNPRTGAAITDRVVAHRKVRAEDHYLSR